MEDDYIVKRRDNCCLCQSGNLQLVLQLASTPIGDNYLTKSQLNKSQEIYPMRLALCSACGHLQLLDIVNPKIIYKDYIYKTSSSITLDNHFKDYAEDTIKRINIPENSFIVDIGSNEGILLKHFKNNNMRVLGVDPAAHIAKRATEQGIPTISSFFNPEVAQKIKQEYGQADVITANNVFANIDNLDEIISAIKILLSPEGIFIMESGYSVDTIEKTIFDNIHHEHLSYFSVEPLIIFFRKHRMKLIDVLHTTAKGGSIRVFVQLTQGLYQKKHSVDHHLNIEYQSRIRDPAIFDEFKIRIEKEKRRLQTVLKDLKKQGKLVVGYGAAIGSSQLIYNFEIGPYIDYIVDDNHSKQGLFSPGLHIPVYHPDEIYKRKSDFIIILAWRYSKPIIKKHQKYINNGGEFIIPFSNPDYEEAYF